MNKTVLTLLALTFIVTGAYANKPVSNPGYFTANAKSFAKTSQTITFPAIAAQKFGAVDLTPAAKATSGLAVTYTSSNAAVATIVSGNIHIVGAGTSTITASQAGNTVYNAATAVGITLTVNKAALTITAVGKTKVYGAANPALTLTYTGFVNGNTNTTGLTTQPTITTTAATASAAGSYPITATGAASTNYVVTYVQGALTVTKAPLTITTVNKTRDYGAANPALTVTYTGFVNGDTQTILTTQPKIATTATTTSPAGTYPITASGAAAANYTITYAAGALTVNKKALVTTIASKTKAYGAANPAFTVTYTGFVNGDTQAAVTTAPTITSTATAASLPGTYPITGSGAVSANYAFTYAPGTLTVTKASLKITAVNKTKKQGAANPALTVTYTGFVNGNTNTTGLTTQPTITTTATTASATGSYPITVSGAVAANYTITYVAGTLTVTAASSVPPVISYAGPKTFTVGTAITAFAPTNTGGAVPATAYAQVSSVAGSSSGTSGFANGTGTAALFADMRGIAIDAAGNIYVADEDNELIRKVTAAGVVTTFAGSGATGAVNGTGAAASFDDPKGIAIDASGNIYVGEDGDGLIRKITPAGVVTTFASFTSPKGLTTDAAGNVYVADEGLSISKITPAGVVTTIYSNQSIGYGIAVDAAGNVYFADNDMVKKITPAKVVTVIAGGAGTYNDGTGAVAGFEDMGSFVMDATGNIYTADGTYIRKITPAGVVTTIAGNGDFNLINGIGTAASFNYPFGLALDKAGNLYISDTGNSQLRKIALTGYTIFPALPAGLTINGATGVISGTPAAPVASTIYTITAANLNGSGTTTLGITVTGTTAPPPIINYTTPHAYTIGTAITALSPVNTGGAVPAAVYAQVSTFAGTGGTGSVNGTGTAASFSGPLAVATDASGNIYVVDQLNNLIRKITPAGVVTTLAGNGSVGAVNGTGTAASFSHPTGLGVDAAGNVYVADQSNNLIRKITTAGVVTTLAGSGTAGFVNGTKTAASFNKPTSIAVDKAGNLYVTDLFNNVIRKVTAAGVVSTFSGSGGTGSSDGSPSSAYFYYPTGITIDINGNLFVADQNNHQIRKINTAGFVSTVAGSYYSGSADGLRTQASFYNPYAVAVDGTGNLYVADYNNNEIRKISTDGIVSTLAGTTVPGSTNGGGTSSAFNHPGGVALDASGNLYVADYYNNKIRKIIVTGYSISPALPPGLAFNNNTGIISGLPAAITPAINYTVSAFNGAGSGSATVNILTKSSVIAPAISYADPQAYTTGTAVSVLPTNTGGAVPANKYGTITLLAGSGTKGAVNGTGALASFSNPSGIATDASGNLYVADFLNSRIRKVTPAGVVTTFAGSGTLGAVNGAAASASFRNPADVVFDSAGNLYVADQGNFLIRKITSAGVVSTFAGKGVSGTADGTGTAAAFTGPVNLGIDGAGNIYVADDGNKGTIRKITPAGVVTTIDTESNNISGLTADIAGDVFYNSLGYIMRLSPSGVKSFLGYAPSGQSLEVDAIGNVYVADVADVLKITPGGGVTHLANGLSFSYSLGIDAAGNVYSGDYIKNIIQKIAGTGYAISGTLPAGLAFNPATGAITGTPTSIFQGAAFAVTGYNLGGSGQAAFNLSVKSAAAAPLLSYAGPQGYTSGTAIAALSPTNTGGAVPATPYATATTFAGSGTSGFVNNTGTAASFNRPSATVTDIAGNLYIADPGNYRIRKITPAGVVSTFAGSGVQGTANGPVATATFSDPEALAIDSHGNIFVSERNANIIRKISPDGTVSLFAGSGSYGSANGYGAAASFASPGGITVDAGGILYVADRGNQKIRGITPDGYVYTYAGTGSYGSNNGYTYEATFGSPNAVVADNAGNIYVSDPGNYLIRKIASDATVTTFAGSGQYSQVDGVGTAAGVGSVGAMTIDNFGVIYVMDNTLIRKITPDGTVTTVAGTGNYITTNGVGTAASFGYATGLAVDGAQNLYISDPQNNVIRKLTLTGYGLTPALPAGLTFNGGTGVISGTPTVVSPGKTYAITASNLGGNSLFNLNITVNGPVATVAPAISYTTPQPYVLGSTISSLSPVNTGGAVPPAIYGQLSIVAGSDTTGAINGSGSAASFTTPAATATDASGNIYVADAGNNRIRKITPSGTVTTFAGSGAAGSANGTGIAASFNGPDGIAVDAAGNVYVSDKYGNDIRKITAAGVVTTLAGASAAGATNGTGTAAHFNQPSHIAIDAAGNLYVADYGNNKIRKITAAGVVTTFAGSGTAGAVNGTGVAASFKQPAGITVDAAGVVYVSDAGNNLIRKITAAGVVTTLAGSGAAGGADGTGTAASFNFPDGLSIDKGGNIYVADFNNSFIRKITAAGIVTTIADGILNDAPAGSTTYLNHPNAVSTDADGNLYVSDLGSYKIKKINITGYTISARLPQGLAFDGTTGAISGTPTSILKTASYVVTAYNSIGKGTSTFSITVNPAAVAAPLISYSGPRTYVKGTAITAISPVNTGGAIPATAQQAVSSFAGSGMPGYVDGAATDARFLIGQGKIAIDKAGTIYVADQQNRRIRKVTPAGVVTTLAGSGQQAVINGQGLNASFIAPYAVTVDPSGNVFVADQILVRKITPDGTVTTFAGGNYGSSDGTGTAASFAPIEDLVSDAFGNIYVLDTNNGLIRKITPAGVVSTFVNNYEIRVSLAMTIDGAGNLYIAGFGEIGKITPDGTLTVIAGTANGNNWGSPVNGTGSGVRFSFPQGIATDAAGNVYIADTDNALIRKMTPAGVVTTLAGSGLNGIANGDNTAARFSYPEGIAVDAAGNVFVSDEGNSMIRKIAGTGYSISPALPAGLLLNPITGVISGTPTQVRAATNYTLTAYNAGGTSIATLNITVKAVAVNPPAISYAGVVNYKPNAAITPLTPANTGGAVPAVVYSQVTTFAGKGTAGSANGTGTAASFNTPESLAFDAAGNMYVADDQTSLIRKITPAGVVTTLAGSGVAGFANGTGTAASFNDPNSLTVDAYGNVFVSDAGNNQIRKITPAGIVTTFAGSGIYGSVDGTGTLAGFATPYGITTDVSGNMYVADINSHKIRKITPAGVVTTLAGSGAPGFVNGTGTAASFNDPLVLVADAIGNVYVSDLANHVIRKITPAGVVTTFAGSGVYASTDGTGTAASFSSVYGITIDAAGNLYVTDEASNLIRKITPAAVVTTLAGTGTAGEVNGVGRAASFNFPAGPVLDASGNLFVADLSNNLIRKIALGGYTISPALPAGLSFNATTGVISGTPTAAHAQTTYTITGYNKDGAGSTTITFAVIAPQGLAATYTPDVLAVSDVSEPHVKPSMSPNGDGIGDMLEIEGIAKYPNNKLMLMSRSGQKVYEAAGYDNINKVFDGHSSINGTMQQAGTYFYILEYKDNGELKRKTGYFLIKY